MTREDQARRRTILQAARELRSDDPSPCVEELVDFVARQPSAEVAEWVREHVTFEKGPRQMVLDLAALHRGEEGGELSDLELEDDWQAMMVRIEDQGTEAASGPGRPNLRPKATDDSPRPRHLRQGSRRRWRQTVSDVLAASFFLTTLGLGYHVLTTDDTVVGFSEVHTLYDTHTSMPRSTQPGKQPPWQELVVRDPTFALSLETDASTERFTSFDIQFFDDRGKQVKRLTVQNNPLDSPKVGVSRDWLPAGHYLIILLGRSAGQGEGVQVSEYPIHLEYHGDPPH